MQFLNKILGGSTNRLKFQREKKKFVANYQPPFLAFSITTRCNFNCPHCLRRLVDGGKTIKKDLPLPVFETALREAWKVGFQNIAFTGGEPILHPSFGELVALTKKHGYGFRIVSNGWLYKDYLPIINSAKENFRGMSLSLDGATAKVHDSFRDKPGSFQRLMEAMELYRKNQISMVLSTCLDKRNYDQLEGIVDICLRFGIESLCVGTRTPAEKSGLTDQEFAWLIQEVRRLNEKNSPRVFISPFTSFFQRDNYFKKQVNFCVVLGSKHEPSIDADGGMIFCCDIWQKCRQKPLIQKEGFEECYRICLETANEIKKQRLHDIFSNPAAVSGTCDYCNKHIERVLAAVRKREKTDKSHARR
jgi:MoaA/NifB/PqqE/SkfB family radical SAM enzyme